jgi:hypothetical protein
MRFLAPPQAKRYGSGLWRVRFNERFAENFVQDPVGFKGEVCARLRPKLKYLILLLLHFSS